MRIYDHTGERQGTWTVIGIVASSNRKTYLLRCDCGNEKTVSSSHITRIIPCTSCKPKIDHDSHIGEKNRKLTCLGYQKVKKGHGYLIQCDCGRQYTMDNYAQFKKNSSCQSCSKGIYPGKRIGHSTVIRRIESRVWEKRCDCGTLFTGRPSKGDCGCLNKKNLLQKAMGKVGNKYHYLTIKKIAGNENGHIQLLIRCKCGNEFIRNNGHEFKSKSCGCELAVPVGEKANKATLKNCEVKSMRELYKAGMYSQGELAKMFNKSEKYINRILNCHIWKHI